MLSPIINMTSPCKKPEEES
uniref:Uncharacterized protein n=1 Tax=Arundo donax TaxID=35708 RepID=A0A0A8Y8W2_ARUDO